MSKNDVTGDEIKTKVSTQAYRDGWDRIFGNKNEKQTDLSNSNLVRPMPCAENEDGQGEPS